MSTAIPLNGAATVAPGAPARRSKAIPLIAPKPTPVEAPADLPEITSQTEIPWNERLGTDLKLMTTNDSWEKARIIAKSFPERIKLGQDTQTKEPIVTIDDKSYVVNKKGFSAQDLNDFVAETGQYLPASILSGGASILARFGLGLINYGATETGREAATYLSGGKKPDEGLIDFGDVGTTATVGATAEALLPPVVKMGGRTVRKIWDGFKAANSMGEDVLDAVITAASAGDMQGLQKALKLAEGTDAGGIPLTSGQSTGNRAALETEAMMRESAGAYGEGATQVIKQADDAQMDQIARQAENLQRDVAGGTGFAPDTPTAIGSRLQGDLIAEEAKRKSVAGAAQEEAKELVRTKPVYVMGDAFASGVSKMMNIPREMGIGKEMMERLPDLKSAMTKVSRISALLGKGTVTKAKYSAIIDFRKSVQAGIDQAGPQTTEGVALINMKSQIDDMVEDALTRKLLSGDPDVVATVKNANSLWRSYKKDFFKSRPDKFGNTDAAGGRMSQILGGETPERVVSFFANISKAAPKKETRELFNRVKTIFGEDSEQIQLIKDAVIYKMFTNSSRKGKTAITRSDIVKNYTEFFTKSGSLGDVMFSAAERDSIRKFAGNVARTIPAEELINPSGTGRFMARLFADMGNGGLVARIGSMARGLPILGEMGGAGYARSLAYMDRLTSAPWGAMATAGIEKKPVKEKLGDAIKSISETIDGGGFSQ